MKRTVLILSLIVLLLGRGDAFATAIRVSNLSLMNKAVSGDMVTGMQIKYDLEWEQSWRNTTNYDAAWVFAKYRVDNENWKPVYISAVATTGVFEGKVGKSAVNEVEKGMGAFIYRNANGQGAAHALNTRMTWDIASENISDNMVISVRVFALEMVYIPQGAFEIGDYSAANRLMKLDSFVYNTQNNTLQWFNGDNGGLMYDHNSLIPAMTKENSNGAMLSGIGRVYQASGRFLAYDDMRNGPWRAFSNKALGNGIEDPIIWKTELNTTGWESVEVQFPSNQKKKAYYAVIKSSTLSSHILKGFYIEGGNTNTDDDVEYTVIGGYQYAPCLNNTESTGNGNYILLRISQPGDYNRYRFNFAAVSFAISYIGLFDDDPYANRISSEDGLYYMDNSNYVSPEYPKGYGGFYVMKYELTQQNYVDFLNTLTYDQQYARTGVNPYSAANTLIGANRVYIRIKTQNATRDGRALYGMSIAGTDWTIGSNANDVPMYNMSWSDGTAFADWAGLRPLTELEYEKMSRGTVTANPGEYVWGSKYITTSASKISLTNINTYQEGISLLGTATMVNCITAITDPATSKATYPVRVGAVAVGKSNRLEAGASFYGVMNLNDNVAERYVNISKIEGRAFTGLHGDGVLTGVGVANVDGWPDATSKGTGYRGFYNNNVVSISDRAYMEIENANRNVWDGFRAGRTAPK